MNKGKKGGKDADEEMTVVVPPSTKQASAPEGDGDVEMGGDEVKAEEVDPAVQAVTGALAPELPQPTSLTDLTQTLRATLRSWTVLLPSSTRASRCAPSGPSRSSAND